MALIERPFCSFFPKMCDAIAFAALPGFARPFCLLCLKLCVFASSLFNSVNEAIDPTPFLRKTSWRI